MPRRRTTGVASSTMNASSIVPSCPKPMAMAVLGDAPSIPQRPDVP
jgi:hypothetical protein